MALNRIDIHTHGIGGYDTRTTFAVDILEIARLQGSIGVSEILPTIYPGPIEEMRQNMAAVKEATERQVTSYRLQVTGLKHKIRRDEPSHVQVTPGSVGGSERPTSHILGVHLEGPFLNPSRCGALDPASFLVPTADNLNRLIEGFEDIVKIITLAPELEGATRLIKRLTDKGIVVSMGHSDATYAEAEAGFNVGARGITHIFNAMRPLHHREPGIAGFALTNKYVYVEVIADPFHLHPETIKLIFSVKDSTKIIIVSDSVKETHSLSIGHRAEGIGQKRQGGQKAEAMPDMKDSKGRLQGGSMAINDAAERLIQSGIEKTLVMPCITSNPASYLGIVS
jgi:N-acetylglucosamine-6-phosphate deacetylase